MYPLPQDMPKARQDIEIPTESQFLDRLKYHVEQEKKGLGEKFFEGDRLAGCGSSARNMFKDLMDLGCDQPEVAMDLTILTLYDLVILIGFIPTESLSFPIILILILKLDDSISTSRYKEIVETTLEQICEVYESANPNGVKSVLFLNHHQGKENVKKADIADIVKRSSYMGVTRIGTELQRKVLGPFALGTKGNPVVMTKPLLVIIITDGVVEGEKRSLLSKVIFKCIATLINDTTKGGHAIAFQFVCFGDDLGAKKHLEFLDDHGCVGRYIDLLPVKGNLDCIGDNSEWNATKWEVFPKLLVGALVSHWDEHVRLEVDDVEDPEIFGERYSAGPELDD